ncbi:MAG: cytochrome P450 [Henriciella sp.]
MPVGSAEHLVSKEIANTIVDPVAYQHWDQSHEAFTELRKSNPIAFAAPDDYDPFWVISKYDDIQTVERTSNLFSNAAHFPTLLSKTQKAQILELTGGSPHIIRSLIQMDNPDHMAHRILTQGWFMTKRLRALEPRIREIAKEYVDQLLETGGECDFATDIAFFYPLRVVMEVIGVPREDEQMMLKLTQDLFGNGDPELSRDRANIGGAKAEVAAQTIEDFFGYFDALNKERRASPKNDLASIIATAKVHGDPIGHLEAMCYYIIAATAGHDTTAASTASSVWAVAERPNVFNDLKSSSDLIEGLVDEAIRWETPVKQFMRTALEDTELGGRKISKGDWLYLAYPSANRDEDHFDRPFEFDPARSPNRHMAFGYGAHVCLGQNLARMEMQILWEEMLPHLKSIELSAPPKRMRANFVCGPKSVPIKFSTT